MPSMISLRYTVLTPGYDGDSSSSSKHSLLMGSNVMTASSIRSLSLTTLCAVCMLFSWGNFLVPDNWLMSALKRPSGYFSAVLMKYLLFAPDPYAMRRRTTSTTRTTFLCFAASSMNRDSPFCTSSTNSSNFFRLALPEFVRVNAMAFQHLPDAHWVDGGRRIVCPECNCLGLIHEFLLRTHCWCPPLKVAFLVCVPVNDLEPRH
mmetsp:Transcript_111221/g.287523  ORF Transcript_111221/g.287523 Transcript_111221/m.287523 type:complete len:205 (+) Transcript_111221:947-1561(+)